MFRSATFKLTVWYLLIIVAISIMFSLVVYHLAVSELASGLTHQSQRFSTEFPAFSSNPLLRQQSELRSGTHQIITNLVVFNVLVLFTAGFGSYALARRTLTPIEQAHEQQKRFTADVSHELRTPLTALKMETEVALLDPAVTKPALRAALQSNLEEAGKLELLINNLLKLTRLEADEVQSTYSNVRLEHVIGQALAQTNQMAEAKRITVKNMANGDVVKGDASTLTQLFVILLDNAVKYSQEGGAIEIEQKHDDRSTLVSITDHGAGIDKSSLAHVFERFYRANKARHNGTTHGYGLGLSIAKHIADMHQGVITISSTLGHGTTVVVRLPAVTTASSA
jgi:signal transduction histidine kinase